LKLIIPVESIFQKKGGLIIYDPDHNKILKQYVHDKKWEFHRVGWRGGVLYGECFIATDWTDLHYFDIKNWKYMRTFKKNTFNDLHYLEIYNDKLFVVNTGLDAIEVFKNPLRPVFEKIEFIFKKNKMFKNRKIDLHKDYNKRLKIKPHSCHPNCISFQNKKIFVNCFGKEQKRGTGEVIELNSGKKVLSRSYDCHDGIFYKGDYFLTWTRHATVIQVRDLANKKFPFKSPGEMIRIKARGWWRGMTIANDKIYVFASDGYKKSKRTTRIRIIDLKTKEVKGWRIPVKDGVHWDTIYQPNILEY